MAPSTCTCLGSSCTRRRPDSPERSNPGWQASRGVLLVRPRCRLSRLGKEHDHVAVRVPADAREPVLGFAARTGDLHMHDFAWLWRRCAVDHMEDSLGRRWQGRARSDGQAAGGPPQEVEYVRDSRAGVTAGFPFVVPQLNAAQALAAKDERDVHLARVELEVW